MYTSRSSKDISLTGQPVSLLSVCLTQKKKSNSAPEMSIIEGISPPTKDEIALIQLKDRIPDIINMRGYESFRDDLYLLRWLIAEHMNAEKTEALIRRAIKWRMETYAYTLLAQELPEDYAWNYPFYSDGVDKQGLPVYSLPAGSWDLRRIIESGDKDKFVRYVTQMYLKIEEHMIALNQERYANRVKNRTNESDFVSRKLSSMGVVIIVNLKGYSRRQLTSLNTVEAALEIATNYGNYFPQMAEKVYLINVSKLFTVLFKTIKPFLNLSCVDVFDTNEKSWKAAILSRINPDQIRPEFGGVKVDPCSIVITTCEDYNPIAE